MNEGLDLRRRETRRAEAIFEEELSRFGLWWTALSVHSTIRELRKNAEDLRYVARDAARWIQRGE
ncbi:MAG: hypothetical protein HY684_03985 [Chloroflexi bacterium]|nr:hypothetical protein [Chloroflexota bacterium]